MANLIHFLNVGNGDCSFIEHKSGRNTLIDICNGNTKDRLRESSGLAKSLYAQGDFKQRYHTINPIDYLKSKNINHIHRFILTHPDMDHMDGIYRLFNEFKISNFWDTNNKKSIPSNQDFSMYKKEDWDFYQYLRTTNDVKVLNILSNDKSLFYNRDKDGGNGDNLYIISPNQYLVDYANITDNYNEISYVILYQMGLRKILFAGDSGEIVWDIILKDGQLKNLVSNIDILIAPHHGRKSGGNNDYLDILKPKLALFGNAKSKDLDYYSFYKRGIKIITNNQAGSILIENIQNNLLIYVTNDSFANAQSSTAFYDENKNAWYIGCLPYSVAIAN